MAKILSKKQYKKDGSYNISGYQIALSKTGVDKTGFTIEDDLEIKYKKNEIKITKK